MTYALLFEGFAINLLWFHVVHFDIFTARPEGQRCQVTPYVENVVEGGSDSEIEVLPAY